MVIYEKNGDEVLMNHTGKKQLILSFSGGKDSLLSLYRLSLCKEFTVVGLLTTLDQNNKVLMHAFDSELLDAQAAALSLPIYKIIIPQTNNDQSSYSDKMRETLGNLKKTGITHIAYGDIFLEDVKKFRESKLNSLGIHGVFPLWQEKSETIAKEFLEVGFNAIITCVNTKLIPEKWVGKKYDQVFLDYIISKGGIDPCGENGEFHTFVYNGPCFQQEIAYWVDINRPIIHNEFYACIARSQRQ